MDYKSKIRIRKDNEEAVAVIQIRGENHVNWDVNSGSKEIDKFEVSWESQLWVGVDTVTGHMWRMRKTGMSA